MPTFAPLHGIRILSLALNLPGPAALLRCRRLGAHCVKLEPPAGDPMGRYNPVAYAELHEGVKVLQADLKSREGQAVVQRELARSDVLLTSFRPSALHKLGLGWKEMHAHYPTLSQVAIVGAAGDRAEEPGHDLTYLAEHGLVTGVDLPPTLYADMSGAHAIDLSWLVSPGTIHGSLLTGMLGFQPIPTVAEVALWLAYAVSMSLYVLWPQRPPAPRRAPVEAQTA